MAFNNAINATQTGIQKTDSSGVWTATTVTNHATLVGGTSNAITSVGPSSTAGQILQSGGSSADPAYSTATYPSTAGSSGKILISDGTNIISSTPTYPATAGTSGNILTSNGTNWTSAAPATAGTVTTVSVVSANGLAGTVATATTTPAITLSTTSTGLLSGNGTAISGTAITQYNVITGGASNAPNSVAPSATSGVPLISQGSAAQPIFGTAVVAGGGTGLTSAAAYSLICGGTTTTGSFQTVADVATGSVLVSGGTAALPAFSATPTVTSISFGGSALGNYVTGGTWTPTLVGGGSAGTTTYSAQNGYYSRIGNIVMLTGYISITAATGTGNATIGTLPIAIANQSNGFVTGSLELNASGWTWPVGRTMLTLLGSPAGTTLVFGGSGSAVSNANLQMSNAALECFFSITYLV